MGDNSKNVEKSVQKPTPFVKWAGGKRQLVDELIDRMPSEYGHYFEPFVGAGALLFELTPINATISDLNGDLINVYKCIKSKTNYPKLIELLDQHEKEHSEEHFIITRHDDRTDGFQNKTAAEKAARAIYLNKTCFNGLYRVNSEGYFNVPSSKKKKVNLYNKDNMKTLHNYLFSKHVQIIHSDFEKVLKDAKKGDFVYLDPPYDQEDTQSFVSYTKQNFNKDDQKRLSKCIDELNAKGVYIMLSNSDTSYIRELYSNYNIDTVFASRLINSKPSGRSKIKELIITNYQKGNI